MARGPMPPGPITPRIGEILVSRCGITQDAIDVIDAVGVLLSEPVEPVVASSAKIVDHINKTYTRLRGGGAELEEGVRKHDDEAEEFQAEELVDMLDANDEAPIIRWVNSL